MKNKFLNIFIFIFLVFSLVGCEQVSPGLNNGDNTGQTDIPEITIGKNGHWYINGEDTGFKSKGDKGDSTVITIGENGNWYIDGVDTGYSVYGTKGEQGPQGVQGEKGEDGHTPELAIGENGNWYIDGIDTGIKATGEKGEQGRGVVSITLTNTEGNVDTYTITYSDNTTSTFTVTNGQDGSASEGIQGQPGKDGHTPVITIGSNGNWFVDGVDTGVKAKGDKGDTGAQGPQGEKGEEGQQGKPGKDGTSLLTGYGYPNQYLGKVGDSYIDINSWDFYVKNESGWTKVGNIKGEPGTSNTDSYEGTEGLEFYPINDYECAVVVGKAKLLKEIIIPAYYKNYVVTSIQGDSSSGAFESCVNLESIVIPNTVTSIGERAFYNCTNLRNIEIPDSVTSIGSYAFYNCSNLESISLGQIDEIRDFTFNECISLYSVEIPNTVKKIGDYAFNGCNNLYDIIIPDSVTTIGAGAFCWCRSLNKIVIPESVSRMGERVFESCISLETVIILSYDTNMKYYSFINLASLASIYCVLESQPSNWDSNWKDSNVSVYWAGEWEYDADGNPVPLS